MAGVYNPNTTVEKKHLLDPTTPNYHHLRPAPNVSDGIHGSLSRPEAHMIFLVSSSSKNTEHWDIDIYHTIHHPSLVPNLNQFDL